MFETYTYDYILNSMLDRVGNEIDKREGSLIYTALAPAAVELAQMYISLDAYANSKWITTAVGEDLDNFAYMFGTARNQATYAIVKATFKNSNNEPLDVPTESRFGLNGKFYTVESHVETGVYLLRGEEAGLSGNQIGTLLPVNYIENLASAAIESIEIFGEEIEQDETFRARTINKITNESRDGNIAQYTEWAENYAGVGKAKIFPLAEGDISHVSIVDPNGKPASELLLDSLQQYLDPETQGLGNGKAPIGAKIKVITAETLNITLNLEIVGSATEESVELVVNEYFTSISFVKNTISYFNVAALISNISTIEQVKSLNINGLTEDIALESNQVPVLETVVITIG